MRAVLQRVSRASVEVEGEVVSAIGRGWLVLLGVGKDDGAEDVARLADKVANLRAFEDDAGKMNLSVRDVGGGVLVVSQFTVMADCRAGRRPGFSDAADPTTAEALYLDFARRVAEAGLQVATGVFRADMQVALINDGPVTFLLDSRRQF
ncbi:D-aminoacyl-tRNA deacylase [Paludisphaera soli]|uniref:D-aminoacyl-tRNA deacylase n=1 Tax=Paludisphaera soli TaxID=2712865 RepID=UPI0013EDB727|nr:D-aminoacyl-tRNA deacylase [Paludisphaera soli]